MKFRSYIAKQASAEKWETNMGAEAEQYSYYILKDRMILSLNILINNILIKKSVCASSWLDESRDTVCQLLQVVVRRLVYSQIYK